MKIAEQLGHLTFLPGGTLSTPRRAASHSGQVKVDEAMVFPFNGVDCLMPMEDDKSDPLSAMVRRWQAVMPAKSV
jgi:hypothetical protein